MYEYNEQISLNEEKCVGCNKCIVNCPITDANIAYVVDGNNKVKINKEKCIHCGKCIKVCDHNAREFKDDTQRFFDALLSGKKLSVIVAPSILVNFHQYKKLFGYLKNLGVNLIYDVSFGADISVWAYLRTMKNENLNSIIAQSCPPIVNYIQKYKPELIDKLVHIQSPMLCTAIFIKKYKNINDDIAFLSPCIAKADEIYDENTYGYVSYNVTFKKLNQYLENKNINLDKYQEVNYDYIGSDLGFLFSRPGGLKENIQEHIEDSWVREVSGSQYAYKYIEEYSRNLNNNKQMPLVVDILNCSYGCNFGTGTCNMCEENISLDEVDYKFDKLKNLKKIEKSSKIENINAETIFDYFDKELKLQDFKREYNRNVIVNDIVELSEKQYDYVFIKMNKFTEESRNINCLSCGYGSCKIMAKCIHNGLNILSNCIYYNKKEVINEHNLLEEKNEFFINMSHELKTPLNVIYSALQMEMNYYNKITINDIKKYNKIINQNCMRLIKLVNNILDLSKIEQGFFKPILVVENIINIVEDTTLSITSFVENKKMNLVFDTEIEELYYKCDANLIERIMLNLLSNAVKYGKEEGTIKVYIYIKESKELVISVKNDGIGIPETMQKKIFDRFQKVDTSLSRKSEGSGMGLSLVKSLVEIQGGTIICKSKSGEGAEFLIKFPLNDEIQKLSINNEKQSFYKKSNTEIVNVEFSDIYFNN